MQGDCLVNILLTSFIKPAAKHSPALSLSLYLALPLSCTHISSRGLTGKGYSNSTLRYNQDHWSNSLLSIYTHIQFVGSLRGVSGEVFVWVDLSGTGPHGLWLMWVWVHVCVHAQIQSASRCVFQHKWIYWIFLHTLAFSHHYKRTIHGKRNSLGTFAGQQQQQQHKKHMRAMLQSVVNPLIVLHIKALLLCASLPACWSTNKVTSPPSEKYIGHSLCLWNQSRQARLQWLCTNGCQ